MKTHTNLYQKLCSKENLEFAYRKARKGKSQKAYIKEFDRDLLNNLGLLEAELKSETYLPMPLETFIIRDPKTRKIRKSHIRDRIVHHAICNIISPIFEPLFIYDSFANRKWKGALKALERFDEFKRKASKNNTLTCFVFKADIRHYFDEVNHDVLLSILRQKIADEQVINLINKVLKNHSEKVWMPLGNLTSQTFQNIYLNVFDQFVKHELRAEFYIRYVDDFVILDSDRSKLEEYKERIQAFLKDKLKLELHQTKSKVLALKNGIPFLGFRNFYYHRLLRKSNMLSMKNKIRVLSFDELSVFLEGWIAYAKNASTFNLRTDIGTALESFFPGHISLMHIDRTMRYANG